LLDSNIVIRFANGDGKTIEALKALNVPYFFISIITYFEVKIGIKTQAEQKEVQQFLSNTVCLDLRKDIVDAALKLKTKKLKFKDHLIAATALHEDLTLVTADRDFKNLENGSRNLKIEWIKT
jgi:predicted nucleic acid-binding protein